MPQKCRFETRGVVQPRCIIICLHILSLTLATSRLIHVAGAQWFGSAVPTLIPAQHGESLQSTFFSFLRTRTRQFQDSNTQHCGCEAIVSQRSSDCLGIVLRLSPHYAPIGGFRSAALEFDRRDSQLTIHLMA